MIALARVDAEGSASEIIAKATSLHYTKTKSRQTRLDILAVSPVADPWWSAKGIG